MKRAVLVIILCVFIFTIINIIFKIYHSDIMVINGMQVGRPNNDFINKTGYGIYRSQDSAEIKIHRFTSIESYKYIYIEPSYLMDGYTIDIKCFSKLSLESGSLVIYYLSKTTAYSKNSFVNFSVLPDSIFFNFKMYYPDRIEGNLLSNDKKTYYRWTLGPIAEHW